jgi:hypothetical protein
LILSNVRFTITLELFFKHALLQDNDRFIKAFMSNGFSVMNEEQGILYKGRFTIRLSRFTRIKGKAINTAAIGIGKDELRAFINHVSVVRMLLKDALDINVNDELDACSLLINSWINDGNDANLIIASVKNLNGIDEFLDYIVHRNPFGKLEFVSKGSELDSEWSKMEIDATDDGEYLISLHYYTYSIDKVMEYIGNSYDKVVRVVKALESCSNFKDKIVG